MINHNRKHLRVFIKHLVVVDFSSTIFDFTEVNSKTMSNATNNITSTTPYVFQMFDNTTLPVFVLFACIAWLVNISLLITIFIDRLHCLKKGSGWFVASMGITSIIIATFVTLFAVQMFPEHAVINRYYPSFLLSALFTAQLAMLLFIVIVSIERFVLTIKPIRYKVFMTESKTKSITIFVWTLSLGNGLLQSWILIYRPDTYAYSRIPYVGLMIIIAVVDGLTFYKLKKSSKALRRMTDNASQHAASARIRLEKRFALVVLMLLVNFLLFASPLFSWDQLSRIDFVCSGCLFKGKLLSSTTYFVLMLLLQLHSTNSALLYLVLVPKYRQSFNANLKAFRSYFIAN